MTCLFEGIVEVGLVVDAHPHAGDVWQLVGESSRAMLLFAVSNSDEKFHMLGLTSELSSPGYSH